jgi:predicted MPP superfamily phosphohydrolase
MAQSMPRKRKPRKLKLYIALVFFSAVCVALSIHVHLSLQPERNDVTINLKEADWPEGVLHVAVLGDLHLAEDEGDYRDTETLLAEVKSADPDLVVFVGDYTVYRDKVLDIDEHRRRILKLLKTVSPIPHAAVLGNYETYSWHHRWIREAAYQGVNVLDNQVQVIPTRKGPVCVRGLSDFWTKKFEYKPYPAECDGLNKLTITHDPAGAFAPEVRGLVIAGHTHCGQVSLPLIGPLWVPTTAPRKAYCGLYQDKELSVFVTSGVGTSILPIRFWARAEWDFLTIQSAM